MRLRQVCLVVPDLQQAAGEIQAVLGLGEGYRDEGVAVWGLENLVMPLGHDFLELAAPTREGTSAGRYLAKRGGPGGYMVILQAEAGLYHRKRITEQGIRTIFTADNEPDIWVTQYHPADCGDVLLEIDSVNPEFDHLDPECPWPPAGPGWLGSRRTRITDRFVAVNFQHHEPHRMALLWSDLLDQPVFDHESYWQIKLQNAVVRFQALRDERGPGIESIDLAMNDMDAALTHAEKLGIRTGERQVQPGGLKINLLVD